MIEHIRTVEIERADGQRLRLIGNLKHGTAWVYIEQFDENYKITGDDIALHRDDLDRLHELIEETRDAAREQEVA